MNPTPTPPDSDAPRAGTPHDAFSGARPGAVDSGRRRLFRGVGGGAGVLLAVSAKSALGQSTCRTPSAAMSGNTSPRPAAATPCVGGKAPGWWKVNKSAWATTGATFPTPANGVTVVECTAPNARPLALSDIGAPGTLLSTVFAGAPQVSLWWALHKPDDTIFGNKGQLLRHLAAAYLNAGAYQGSTGRYPLLQSDVVKMWNDTHMGGSFCPASMPSCKAPWNSTAVMSYISGLWEPYTETALCKA